MIHSIFLSIQEITRESGIHVPTATKQPVIMHNSLALIAMNTIKQIWTANIKVLTIIHGPVQPAIIVIRKEKAKNDRKNNF